MSTRKYIYNNTEAAAQEAVAGLLLARGDLRLVGGTNNVLVRADIESYRTEYVTIICGGGSGHEPAHAGYIGDGLLACAVLGNVFASPSVDAVYRAIAACASPHGVLVIVKNYTGDRLNFGMAIEKAKAEGIRVRMVIVGDDCTAVSSGSIAGRRGVAGTLFVQKIAGAKAHSHRCDFDSVCEAAEMACRAVRTMGIGLTSCHLPGSENTQRLEGPQMEVGIGIHGEPGRAILDIPPVGLAGAMARVIMDALKEARGLPASTGDFSRIAVMVNNLGATTELEMNAFVSALFPELANGGFVVERLYVGAFMTALDMHGVSVTLFDLSISDCALELLDYPVTAPAWVASRFKGARIPAEAMIHATPYYAVHLKDTIFTRSDQFTSMMRCICAELVAAEPLLAELDSVCGDGDCGQTVRAAAQEVLNKLQGVESVNSSEVFSNTECANTCIYLADNASVCMGGTLGAIMELLLRAMASYYHSASDQGSLSSALEVGVQAVSFYGGAKLGMRTMLDALHPAINALKAEGSLEAAAAAAEIGAESTCNMEGLAGRSTYVNPDAITGVRDPGAAAVSIAFRAAAGFSKT